MTHDTIIMCKHFPHKWPLVKRINWSLVDLCHKGPVMQCFDVVLSLRMSAWMNCCANSQVARDFRLPGDHVTLLYCDRHSGKLAWVLLPGMLPVLLDRSIVLLHVRPLPLTITWPPAKITHFLRTEENNKNTEHIIWTIECFNDTIKENMLFYIVLLLCVYW